jgi:molybdenum-dependent DNA-binding transcriptional regulator ModE
MPKSRNRGGVKEHRARVKKRNARLLSEKNAFRKEYTRMMEQKIEEMKAKGQVEQSSSENNSQPE